MPLLSRFTLIIGLMTALVFAVPASATGTRIVDRDTANMATYHFERAERAMAKAEEIMAKAAGDEGKRASLTKKAQKQYKKAAALYERALRVSKTYPGARENLGIALLKSGNAKKAREVLTQVSERNPDDETINGYLAEAEALLGSE